MLRRARCAAVLLLPACFHPVYDRPRCGPDGACPSGLTCSPELVCESGSDANDPDGPGMSHVVLTWQLTTTLPSGAPSQQLDYPPFAPDVAPQIRIATLDGPFTSVPYSSEAATPGWIAVPRSYFDPPSGASAIRPWRLEYTLPGGVPHEVQWAPENGVGHLVVPRVGRLDRLTVPPGSGYHVTLPNFQFPTAVVHHPRVFTTGLWTTGLTAQPVNNPDGISSVVDDDFANATPLSGAMGIPVAAQGDRGFLVDYVSNPDNNGVLCNVAVGSTPLDQLALTSTGHTPQTATWDALREAVISELPDSNVFKRLAVGLGGLHTMFTGQDSWLLFGSVPSTRFPGLIGTSADFRLPVPVIQTLLQCPQGPLVQGPTDPSLIPATAQPTLLADFPTAVHVQLVEARPVQALGVTLYSGLETVIAAPAGGSFKMSFPAAIPTKITLTPPASSAVDLVGTPGSPDQIAVGASTGAFTLGFTPDTGTGVHADSYDVYLHRISDSKLTTERIYTVTVPEVRIDGAVFVPGADYVFEIRSYAGHPMAARGDFAPVDYPYGSAVVFTRTFKTS